MLRETESKEGYTTRARSETVVSLTKAHGVPRDYGQR